jgi:hypothetical protein
MKPSVGRIIHYVSYGSPVREDGSQAFSSECRAAVITQVHDAECVGLMAMNPTGLFFHDESWIDEENHSGGSWHWPERVE